MSQHVDTVFVSVSKFDLEVQEFVLTAAVNEIPSIVLKCLPVDTPKGQNGVSAPTVAELRKKYSQLLKASYPLDQEVTVDISVVGGPSSQQTCNQTVTLENWILSDVGLSTLTTTGAPVLLVVLKHRTVKMAHVGEIYEVPLLANQWDTVFQTMSSSDMVEFMTDVDQKVSGDIVPFYDLGSIEKEGSKVKEQVISFRKKGIGNNLPNKYLDGKGGIFLDPCDLGPLKPLRNEALAKLMFPFDNSISLWNTVIGVICPHCLMQVRPTYNEKNLQLEPLRPWYPGPSGLHTVKDDMIEAIELPGADPDPICGIAVQRDEILQQPTQHTGTDATRTADGEVAQPIGNRHAFYIPDEVDPGNRQYGRLVTLRDNIVISALKQYDKATGDGVVLDKVHAEGDNKKYVDPQEAYAKAMFKSLYRKNCTASVTTTLAFTDSDGKMIYPGERLNVTAEGNDLFEGYVRRLTVTGSTRGGCRTKFDLAYIKSPEYDVFLVKDDKNECYSND